MDCFCHYTSNVGAWPYEFQRQRTKDESTMRTKQLIKPAKYNESKEEAKHPVVLLALIMGVYPAVIIIGLLIAIGYFAIRSRTPIDVPATQSYRSDVNSESPTASPDKELELKIP